MINNLLAGFAGYCNNIMFELLLHVLHKIFIYMDNANDLLWKRKTNNIQLE